MATVAQTRPGPVTVFRDHGELKSFMGSFRWQVEGTELVIYKPASDDREESNYVETERYGEGDWHGASPGGCFGPPWQHCDSCGTSERRSVDRRQEQFPVEVERRLGSRRLS